MVSRIRSSLLAALCGIALCGGTAHAAPKTHFKLAWTIYAGWMPWPWAADQGIVKKWADRYHISIDVVQVNDYAESINQYTAGAFDALTVTNMDALAVPAVGGVDSTAVIVGDFSNGNDAVILKGQDKLAAIKGQPVNLVQFSVSHYLLDRALETAGMSERDVKVTNTSDADMAAAFRSADVNAVVTWNPIVQEILKQKDAHEVFDSSKIPGEIIDLAIVNTATLHDNPALGKALAGIWYETMAIMRSDTKEGRDARAAMGKLSGTDLAGFDSQLATTHLFATPQEAVAFTSSPALSETMDRVRHFLFDHGLMGDDAKSADVVGISFPGGKVLGDKSRIRLRFTTDDMELARTGK